MAENNGIAGLVSPEDQNELDRRFVDAFIGDHNDAVENREAFIRDYLSRNPDAQDRNRAAQEKLLNYLQFEYEPSSVMDRVIADEAAFKSQVPFGSEDRAYIADIIKGSFYQKFEPDAPSELLIGLNRDKGAQNFVPGVAIAGRNFVPFHEARHSFVPDARTDQEHAEEELGIRALDYFTVKNQGADPETLNYMKKMYLNAYRALPNGENAPKVWNADVEKDARLNALNLTRRMSNDKFYGELTEAEKRGLRGDVEQYMDQYGFFNPALIDPSEMSDSEFMGILSLAPGLNFKESSKANVESPERYYLKPREFGDGGVAGLAPMAQNMFRN
jgi:hypothetical protein